MNEEFKKKYLKYKIKYLELIGGAYDVASSEIKRQEGEEKTELIKTKESILKTLQYFLQITDSGNYWDLFKHSYKDINKILFGEDNNLRKDINDIEPKKSFNLETAITVIDNSLNLQGISKKIDETDDKYEERKKQSLEKLKLVIKFMIQEGNLTKFKRLPEKLRTSDTISNVLDKIENPLTELREVVHEPVKPPVPSKVEESDSGVEVVDEEDDPEEVGPKSDQKTLPDIEIKKKNENIIIEFIFAKLDEDTTPEPEEISLSNYVTNTSLIKEILKISDENVLLQIKNNICKKIKEFIIKESEKNPIDRSPKKAAASQITRVHSLKENQEASKEQQTQQALTEAQQSPDEIEEEEQPQQLVVEDEIKEEEQPQQSPDETEEIKQNIDVLNCLTGLVNCDIESEEEKNKCINYIKKINTFTNVYSNKKKDLIKNICNNLVETEVDDQTIEIINKKINENNIIYKKYPYKLVLKIIIECADIQKFEYNGSVINKIKKIYNALPINPELIENTVEIKDILYNLIEPQKDQEGDYKTELKETIRKIDQIKKRDIKIIGDKPYKNRTHPYVGELFISNFTNIRGWRTCPVIYDKREGDKLTLNVLQTEDANTPVFGFDSCAKHTIQINQEKWNNEWTEWEPLLLHILKTMPEDSPSWLNWNNKERFDPDKSRSILYELRQIYDDKNKVIEGDKLEKYIKERWEQTELSKKTFLNTLYDAAKKGSVEGPLWKKLIDIMAKDIKIDIVGKLSKKRSEPTDNELFIYNGYDTMWYDCPHIYREEEGKIERLDTGDTKMVTTSCSTKYYENIIKDFFGTSGDWRDWIPLSFFILNKVTAQENNWTEWKFNKYGYNFIPELSKTASNYLFNNFEKIKKAIQTIQKNSMNPLDLANKTKAEKAAQTFLKTLYDWDGKNTGQTWKNLINIMEKDIKIEYSKILRTNNNMRDFIKKREVPFEGELFINGECPYISINNKIKRLDSGETNFGFSNCSEEEINDFKEDYFKTGQNKWSYWKPLSLFILDKVRNDQDTWTDWNFGIDNNNNYQFDPRKSKKAYQLLDVNYDSIIAAIRKKALLHSKMEKIGKTATARKTALDKIETKVAEAEVTEAEATEEEAEYVAIKAEAKVTEAKIKAAEDGYENAAALEVATAAKAALRVATAIKIAQTKIEQAEKSGHDVGSKVEINSKIKKAQKTHQEALEILTSIVEEVDLANAKATVKIQEAEKLLEEAEQLLEEAEQLLEGAEVPEEPKAKVAEAKNFLEILYDWARKGTPIMEYNPSLYDYLINKEHGGYWPRDQTWKNLIDVLLSLENYEPKNGELFISLSQPGRPYPIIYNKIDKKLITLELGLGLTINEEPLIDWKKAIKEKNLIPLSEHIINTSFIEKKEGKAPEDPDWITWDFNKYGYNFIPNLSKKAYNKLLEIFNQRGRLFLQDFYPEEWGLSRDLSFINNIETELDIFKKNAAVPVGEDARKTFIEKFKIEYPDLDFDIVETLVKGNQGLKKAAEAKIAEEKKAADRAEETAEVVGAPAPVVGAEETAEELREEAPSDNVVGVVAPEAKIAEEKKAADRAEETAEVVGAPAPVDEVVAPVDEVVAAAAAAEVEQKLADEERAAVDEGMEEITQLEKAKSSSIAGKSTRPAAASEYVEEFLRQGKADAKERKKIIEQTQSKLEELERKIEASAGTDEQLTLHQQLNVHYEVIKAAKKLGEKQKALELAEARLSEADTENTQKNVAEARQNVAEAQKDLDQANKKSRRVSAAHKKK